MAEDAPKVKVDLVDRAGEERSIEPVDEVVTMYADYPDFQASVMPDGRGFFVHVRPEGWSDLEAICVECRGRDVRVWLNQPGIADLKVSRSIENHVVIRPERSKTKKSRNRDSRTSRMGLSGSDTRG